MIFRNFEMVMFENFPFVCVRHIDKGKHVSLYILYIFPPDKFLENSEKKIFSQEKFFQKKIFS